MDRDDWIRDRFDKQDNDLKEMKADLKAVRRLVDMAMGAWAFLVLAVTTVIAAIKTIGGARHG
jgi:hypothetical protein